VKFDTLLEKYRKESFSQRDKGDKFERLMKGYLQSDPMYATTVKKVWLWNEFPGRGDLGGSDTGIDLVVLTFDGDYWAVQCKCYQELQIIDKAEVDTFIATSSKAFKGEDLKTTRFARRLWFSTTERFTSKAENSFVNQDPPATLVRLSALRKAPIEWDKLEDGING